MENSLCDLHKRNKDVFSGTSGLLRFHGQRRGGVAAGDSCVGAGRVGATGLRAGPDIHHGIGDEHRGFDDQLPVAVHRGLQELKCREKAPKSAKIV